MAGSGSSARGRAGGTAREVGSRVCQAGRRERNHMVELVRLEAGERGLGAQGAKSQPTWLAATREDGPYGAGNGERVSAGLVQVQVEVQRGLIDRETFHGTRAISAGARSLPVSRFVEWTIKLPFSLHSACHPYAGSAASLRFACRCLERGHCQCQASRLPGQAPRAGRLVCVCSPWVRQKGRLRRGRRPYPARAGGPCGLAKIVADRRVSRRNGDKVRPAEAAARRRKRQGERERPGQCGPGSSGPAIALPPTVLVQSGKKG